MKILVLCTDYPNQDNRASLHYIHVRNKYYLEKGIDVIVLNFFSNKDYEFEGIKVISLESYKNRYKDEEYDILLSHAPNLRNHYLFMKKYEEKFNRIIFFFHGHEVLKTSKVYPKPYFYIKKDGIIKRIIQDAYDEIKLTTWRHYLKKLSYKSEFIFVSEWMKNEFLKWTRIEKNIIEHRSHIIYNGIHSEYEINSYNSSSKKIYDFITIRAYLDGSKYCVDLLCDIAKRNPKRKFLLVGKGKYFNYNTKPDNLDWIDGHLRHSEIIDLLNKSKCALMLTRTDAQGLMMCEMASFGIPLITSNISVCKEVLNDFNNVIYVDNDYIEQVDSIDINSFSTQISKKNEMFFKNNTCQKEVKLFYKD